MSFDPPSPELTPDDEAALAALLGSAAIWEPDVHGDEDAIVASITALAGSTPGSEREHVTASTAPASAGVTPLPAASKKPRWLAAVAAAVLVVAGGAFALNSLGGQEGVEVALSGTDLAPDASATALVDEGDLGVKINIEIEGLAPAPDGFYYEAWVRESPEVGVSAGTFHLRGADPDEPGAIELWAGVSTEDYPLITVTLQEEGGGPASSGEVVLKGTISE